MSGLLLRLAGPLQSWGEHSAFGERDTCRFPTRSGLLGMFAAAQGHSRTTPPPRGYSALEFTIRIDRAGIPLVDFHTVGGGYPAHRTVPTAEGKRRQAGAGTIVSRRHYLADASFTIAVTTTPDNTDVLQRIGDALANPHWPPYLGRRSCPPDAPLLLRTDATDPVEELHSTVPVDGPQSHDGTVIFVTEHPNGQGGNEATEAPVDTELNDVPISFAPRHREYRTRQVTLTPRRVPEQLYASAGQTYLDRLEKYLTGETR